MLNGDAFVIAIIPCTASSQSLTRYMEGSRKQREPLPGYPCTDCSEIEPLVIKTDHPDMEDEYSKTFKK
jgi:hypothetical protein